MPSNDAVKRYSVNRNLFDIHEVKPGGEISRLKPPETIFVLADDYDRDTKTAWQDGLTHGHTEAEVENEALEDEVRRLRGVISTMVKRSDYDEQATTIERLHASIELLDTLPDAHLIAEQAKAIKRLRGLLSELHGQVPHTCASDAMNGMCVGCAYDNAITVTLAETDAALKGET